MSKAIQDCFVSTSLCFEIVPAPSYQLMRCKTTNNHDLVTRVFPRFKKSACHRFEFSFAIDDVILCSDRVAGKTLVFIFRHLNKNWNNYLETSIKRPKNTATYPQNNNFAWVPHNAGNWFCFLHCSFWFCWSKVYFLFHWTCQVSLKFPIFKIWEN